MTINWISYYFDYDGYGRFSSRLVNALQQEGVDVKHFTMDERDMPYWMQYQKGLYFDNLTISMLPPYYVKKVPGRQWLFTMCEGSLVPGDWVDTMHNAGLERVIVPCEHNKKAFEDSGLLVPITVIPGGTDPDEFPIQQKFYPVLQNDLNIMRKTHPYTFLTFSDRGFRKGWEEVWKAFYLAFGGKTTGRQDVRLIIKGRPGKKKTTTKVMASGEGLDPRIIYDHESYEDLRELYRQADCLALPSRSEGWGMPHRECAMMGIPTITQQYSGLDDGHIYSWSLVVEEGRMKPIPRENKLALGEWMVADTDSLAEVMERCYNHPQQIKEYALKAAAWLRENQTWGHSARALMEVLNASSVECSTLSLAF